MTAPTLAEGACVSSPAAVPAAGVICAAASEGTNSRKVKRTNRRKVITLAVCATPVTHAFRRRYGVVKCGAGSGCVRKCGGRVPGFGFEGSEVQGAEARSIVRPPRVHPTDRISGVYLGLLTFHSCLRW